MKLFVRILTIIYFGIFYRVEIVNAGNVPEKGPVLVCANHNGVLDMFFLGYRLKRWVHWMAKAELFKNPVIGAIFKSLGAFPVKRGKGDVGSIKNAIKLLNNDKIVGIFPQGTRVDLKNRDTIRIKPGAAMLALNSEAVVVPVALSGSYKLFSRVRVVFGEPFRPDFVAGHKPTTEELSEISRNIMDRIISLMEE